MVIIIIVGISFGDRLQGALLARSDRAPKLSRECVKPTQISRSACSLVRECVCVCVCVFVCTSVCACVRVSERASVCLCMHWRGAVKSHWRRSCRQPGRAQRELRTLAPKCMHTHASNVRRNRPHSRPLDRMHREATTAATAATTTTKTTCQCVPAGAFER